MKFFVVVGGLLMLVSKLAAAPPVLPDASTYLQAGGFGCQACHGVYGDGAVSLGNYIRGASLDKLEQSLQEEPTMVMLQKALDEQQRADILEYLTALAQYPLVRLHLGEEKSIIEPISSGQWVQVLLYNHGFEQQVIDLTVLGLPATVVAPKTEFSVFWQAEEGTYEVAGYTFIVTE